MGRLFQFLLCLGIAIGTAYGLFFWDQKRVAAEQEATALNLARQTVAQAEGFAYMAREKNDKDAVGSAVRLFTQGSDARLIQVERHAGEFASRERHFFNAETHALEFRKILMPETGDGIKVHVKLPWKGFFGARNRIESDAALGAIGVFTFFTFWFFCSLIAGRHRRQARATRARVLSWITVTRNILTELSIALREVIRSAQKMAKMTSKSQGAVKSLRDRIHTGVSDLHASRKLLTEGEQTLAQAEAVSLSASMEAMRLGPQATRLAQVTADVHRKIQKMRKTMQESAGAIQKLEIAIEPCATDADIAFNAFEGMSAVSTEMREHIRKSTETIQSQARMFDMLRDELMDTRERARAQARAAKAVAPILAEVPAEVLTNESTAVTVAPTAIAKTARRRSKKSDQQPQTTPAA